MIAIGVAKSYPIPRLNERKAYKQNSLKLTAERKIGLPLTQQNFTPLTIGPGETLEFSIEGKCGHVG